VIPSASPSIIAGCLRSDPPKSGSKNGFLDQAHVGTPMLPLFSGITSHYAGAALNAEATLLAPLYMPCSTTQGQTEPV